MISHTRLLSFLQRLMTRRKLVMSLIPVFMSSCCQQHLHKKKRENDFPLVMSLYRLMYQGSSLNDYITDALS